MAKIAISIKINLNNIDNARLFTGQKGTYLDATAFIDLDELDQFGNSGMITQSVTKEEKAQGIKGNILGNTKVFWKDSGQAPQQQQYQQQQGGQQWQQPQQQQQGQYSGQQGSHGAQQQGWQGQQQQQQQYQQSQQQAQPQYNNPPADFDDDIPFAPVGLQHGNKFLHCC